MSVCPELIVVPSDFKGKHPDLWELSRDLREILHQELLYDIRICVIENNVKNFKCHKDILCTRSKWFSEKILEASTSKVDFIEVNEKHEIMNAVLKYIYTADLELLESLSIPLIDLHKAAEKYGLTSLKNIVTDVIKSDSILDKTKSIKFTWNVAMDQHNYISAVCPLLQDFTLYGSDKWGLEIQPLIQGDETRMSEFYVIREVADEAHNITHTINITVYLVNTESSALLFSREISASENGKYKTFVLSANSDNTESSSDTPITLSCELTVCAKGGDIENFHLKGIHRRHIHGELLTMSKHMYDMLKNSKYSDISVKPTGNSEIWRLHSYIIFGRLKMPIPFIAKLANVADYDCEGWRSFIFYLYTGQNRYLEEHMLVVFNFFMKYKLRAAAQKYELIIGNNLNLSNAFDILCDSLNNGSLNLLTIAAQYLSLKSGFAPHARWWVGVAKSAAAKAVFHK